MTGSASTTIDHEATVRHLDAARTALQALASMAAPGDRSIEPAGGAGGHLRQALRELNDIDNLLADGLVDARGPARVLCSHCGKPIMATATLCGYCWRRRDPPASDQSNRAAGTQT